MRTIDEVRAALVQRLGDEVKLVLLNSRVILRTGVNLVEPRPAHRTDPAAVERVLGALREMGFDLNGARGG